MENLSIDQLADLKIAIKKNDKILIEKEARNTELTGLNSNFIETNKRLEQEIELQDSRITEAKAENEELRKEKEGILSQFAVDNEKAYKELREKEEKIGSDTQVNALRLIELEKRESKLVNKESSNKAILNEAKEVQKDAKQETILAEEKLINVEAKQKKLKLEEEKIDDKTVALKEIEKELNEKRLEINEKEMKTLGSIQQNQNLVAELTLKQKNDKTQIERLEKLNALFSELKGYVTANANVSIEDIESFINPEEVDGLEEVSEAIKEEEKEDTPSNEEIIDEIETEITEKEEDEIQTVETDDVSIEKLTPQPEIKVTEVQFDINVATYPEMLAEAKKRGMTFEKQQKKDALTKLLSK